MRKILILLTILIWGSVLPSVAQVDPTKPRYDEFGNPVDRYGNALDPSTQPKNLKDSTEGEIVSMEPKLFMWQISERLGIPTRVPVDTIFLNFQNSNLDEGYTNTYNHLGNMGSPRVSHIFFNQSYDKDTPFFMKPFSHFYFRPSEFKFTNSNIPYTNLTYYKSGNKINGEDRLKAYFSVNVNEKLAFGFNIDYLYGRGYYNHQSTAFFNGGIFGSYRGDRYEAYFMYNNFMLKMAENGGITDDRYITKPEDMADGKQKYESQNIPTNLNSAWNRNSDFYVYYNQRYNIGFTKETKVVTAPLDTTLLAKHNDDEHNETDHEHEHEHLPAPQPKDSVVTKFVPVTSFIHTFKVERNKHRFISRDEPKGYFPNTYINLDGNSSNDINTYIGYHNTLGIALAEGFNKYAKAGLTAFFTYKANRYTLPTKDITRQAKYTEGILFVGAELARRQGKILNYRAMADFGLSEKYTGNFNIDADADLNLKFRKDTLIIKAFANIGNNRPHFYMRHYHANHYYWDEGKNGMPKLKDEFTQKIGGEISFPKWQSKIRVAAENLKNYTYLGPEGTPLQYSDNIQILGATLNQNFKLGIFHLDNEVTWQKSSKRDIIPLPSITLYHNLYIETKIAKKVLSVQLGADVRYTTKYKALAYMPGIQQFHVQPDEGSVNIGAYPVINVYANIQLKQTRIFAMMYHVNQRMGNNNAFTSPHYPINPRLFKLGISWNFYD